MRAEYRVWEDRRGTRLRAYARAVSASPPVAVFLWSRAAIWLAAIGATVWFEPQPPPLRRVWDSPVLHDLGYGVDVLARWDSAWYLRIAEHGYGVADGAAAFFPLYPGLVAALGRILGGHYVLAGVLLSLAACLAAFALLHRLGEELVGERTAARAVLYLAVFPMAIFLQAVYAESLFLVLVLAAFLLAERGRFPAAALATGLALLTRPSGVALLPPLALLAWRSRDRARNLAWLLAAPLLFGLYPFALQLELHDPGAFLHSQSLWHRHVSPAGPLGGIWDGLRAGWSGIRQLASGSRAHAYWPLPGGVDPIHVAAVNLEGLAALLLFAWLAWVAWARIGAAYGLFAACSLALPLSEPSSRFPLLSLPRFGVVVFPLFLALALVGERPRRHDAIVAASAVGLGVVICQWTLWQWVS